MLHTDIPTEVEIRRLAAERDPVSVSIYLRTSPLPLENDKSRIQLGNLVVDAETQLRATGAEANDIADIITAVTDLVEDRPFWTHQSHTLALFAVPGNLQTFRIPNNLSEMVEVSDRFLLTPLLRALAFPQAAFVLALSQHSARLVELTIDDTAFEVDVADLPNDGAGFTTSRGTPDSMRLEGADDEKVRLRHYCRHVDAALRPLLAGRRIPLILAAAEPIATVYRTVNSYGSLAPQTIRGNPDSLNAADLAAPARSILDELYAHEVVELRERVETAIARGDGITDLSDLARAATFGAIDTLMVDIDQKVSGFLDERNGALTLTENEDALDYGIVDELARRALLTGARVVPVRAADVPGGGVAAAITRFDV